MIQVVLNENNDIKFEFELIFLCGHPDDFSPTMNNHWDLLFQK